MPSACFNSAWIFLLLVWREHLVETIDQSRQGCNACTGIGNSTCRFISGIFTRPQLPVGYNLIAKIPSGTCNISIMELKPTRNNLALRTASGSYVLNGDWAINWSGDYVAAGTTFSYQRHDTTPDSQEHITAPGPISEDVDIMVIFQQPNPGIKYEYQMPMKVGSPLPRIQTPAQTPEQAPPLRIPGGPYPRPGHLEGASASSTSDQASNPVNDGAHFSHTSYPGYTPLMVGRPGFVHGRHTVNPQNGLSHGPGLVHYSAPPMVPPGSSPYSADDGVLRTNPQAGRGTGFLGPRQGSQQGERKTHDTDRDRATRPFSWRVSGLSPCTKTCGGGEQRTVVMCVKKITQMVVSENHCKAEERPIEQTVRCSTKPCPAMWVPDKWSECSVTCGEGIQRRVFLCKQEISPTLTMKVSEGACFGSPLPPVVQKCELGLCSRWEAGEWGQCTTECGKGMRKRDVMCIGPQGTQLPPEECKEEERPVEKQVCDMGSCAPNTWFFSDWSIQCSEECGVGNQKRKIHCSSGGLNSVPDNACDPFKKPSTTRPCKSDVSCHGKWFAGPWSQCSVQCGKGKKIREVLCVAFTRGQFRVALDINCPELKKPHVEKSCEIKPCLPEWFMTDWGECSRSCDTGVQMREIKCLNVNRQPSMDCPVSETPEIRQSCSTQSCPEINQDSGCVDKFRNCHLVVQARLCHYNFYSSACCHSCNAQVSSTP